MILVGDFHLHRSDTAIHHLLEFSFIVVIQCTQPFGLKGDNVASRRRDADSTRSHPCRDLWMSDDFARREIREICSGSE